MQRITRKELQRIAALSERKERLQQQRFKVEGRKIISDLLASGYAFQAVYSAVEDFPAEELCRKTGAQYLGVSPQELKQMSNHQTPQGMLALASLPKPSAEKLQFPALLLDSVQDPGNMGTIVRIADWYGIRHLICNTACADLYNPKVLQATMGSFARITLHAYEDLFEAVKGFRQHHPNLRVVVTSLNGSANIPRESGPVLLCMGNESKGISPELSSIATHHLLIGGAPSRFADSLNVSVACGIACDRLFGSDK